MTTTTTTETTIVVPAVVMPTATIAAVGQLRDLIERAEPLHEACEAFYREHLPVLDGVDTGLSDACEAAFDAATGFPELFRVATRLAAALSAAVGSVMVERPDFVNPGPYGEPFGGGEEVA